MRSPVSRKEVQKLKGVRQIKFRAPTWRPETVNGLFAVAAVRAAACATVAALVGTARVAAGALGRELGFLGHGANGEDGNNRKNSQNTLHFKSPSERLPCSEIVAWTQIALGRITKPDVRRCLNSENSQELVKRGRIPRSGTKLKSCWGLRLSEADRQQYYRC